MKRINLIALLLPIACSFTELMAFPEGREPAVPVPTFPADTTSITAFGAIANSMALQTDAINQTIDAVHRKGGGVVLLEAGIWLSGPIVLKSNVNLHLAKNALLHFTDDFSQYRMIETSWEGIPQMRNQSPIWALNQQNIAITGAGVIDGNGGAWRMVKKGKMTESQWKKLLSSGGVLNEKKDIWYPSESALSGASYKDAGRITADKDAAFYEGIKDFLRPNMVLIEGCEGVLLEGVTFQNSAAWNIHPLMSNDITIRNIAVRNPWFAQNGDGLDIESCQNVLVENSNFDVGDDAICIKSGRDEAGRERDRPTQDVWVRNCTVYHAHGGFVVGSEMSGGARNLYVDNCTFIGTDIGLRFKTTRGRGGVVENVFINNIFMKDIPGEAILFDMYYEAKDPIALSGERREPPKVEVKEVSASTPQFRHFQISNVTCDGAAKGLFIRGLPEMHINDISLKNITIRSTEGIDIQEASNVKIKNAVFTVEKSNPLLYIVNSEQLTVDGLIYENAESLLHVQGGRSNNIKLLNTDTKKAKNVVRADYGAKENAVQFN